MSDARFPKCSACGRVTATHAEGCSLVECPHRACGVWQMPEGAQGFPGTLAEDRVMLRREPLVIED